MPIFQAGSINTTAIVVPNLYVQISPPQALRLNGVPSYVVGVVGTAPWGPVNLPIIIAGMNDYDREFGQMQNRLHDMGTLVATAVLQRAADFRCIRVTDGTDSAASLTVVDAGTFTAFHTGSLGNSARINISVGSKPATHRVVIGFPGRIPEVFDNIPDATFWVSLGKAINVGQSLARGASETVTFVPIAVPVAAISNAIFSLAGGTDGADAITTFNLVGADAGVDVAGTGMFALRGSGCSIAAIADLHDSAALTTIDSFAGSEEIYMVAVGAPGQTITQAKTEKQNAGLDSPNVLLLMGDWLYFSDPIYQTIRLVSPQGFAIGLYGNLSPEKSGLNKILYGIVGSQRTGIASSGHARRWSNAELTELFRAGIDIITTPAPGGSYWALRGGFNSSTNATINGDNYPRLTNYISQTLAAGMGLYVGSTITPDLFNEITSTLASFLGNMKTVGQIAEFSCICSKANNPTSRTDIDIVQADVVVKYNGINKTFIVNLLAGQTIQVTIA